MGKIDLKISKQQYKQLLNRVMNKKAVEEQASIAADMGNMMGEMSPGSNMQPLANPQMGMQGEQGVMPPVAPTSAIPPTENLQSPAPMQPMSLNDRIANAEEIWNELKGSIGEQIWNRLFQEIPDKQGVKNPGAYFIASTVKFLQNPNSIQDERIKGFLGGIVGQDEEGQVNTGEAQSPFPQQMSPMAQTILDSIQ